jgi:hypothetical protein
MRPQWQANEAAHTCAPRLTVNRLSGKLIASLDRAVDVQRFGTYRFGLDLQAPANLWLDNYRVFTVQDVCL